MQHIPMLVGQHLDFDMAGIDQELLQIDVPIPKAGDRLLLCGVVGGFDLIGRTGDPDTASAAAR